MATGQLNGIMHALRHVVRVPDACSDGQLLDAFVTRRDEAAFETLMRRHAAMVWGVCRRLLGHKQDAEDAFQATFLVLVRKAGAITRRELVGNWLYGAAYRAALEARNVRRRTRERQVSGMPEPQAKPEANANPSPELWPILDHELSRLPDKYRVPMVLCDLEGRTRREVARALGLADGTLSGRLTTARRLLAKQLAGRGVNLSGAAVAVALSQATASAAVPPTLLAGTVSVATAAAASSALSTSTRVALITERVVKGMFVTKLKTVLSASLAVAVLATTLVLSLARGQEAPPEPAPAAYKDTPRPSTAPAKPDGVRKMIEAIDWTLTDVNDTKNTISVDDHANHIPAGAPRLILVATPNGQAASGFSLDNLAVAEKAKITLDGKEATLKDLKPGMRVQLRSAGDRTVIAKIDAASPRPPVFRYVLKAVDAKKQTLTVTLADKELDLPDLPVAKDAEIKFLDVNVGARFQNAKLEDLQPGMHLALELAAEKQQVTVRRIVATK
jgi:RNA polymerase sigma factor (sigma-70 family)